MTDTKTIALRCVCCGGKRQDPGGYCYACAADAVAEYIREFPEADDVARARVAVRRLRQLARQS